MSSLSWATHPNAALRLRIAEYIARGWKVDGLGEDWALLSRQKAWTGLGRILVNPLYVLYFGRGDRADKVRLSVSETGAVMEARI